MRKRLRLYFAILVGFVIFIQIIAFSPSRLEEEAPPIQVEEAELRPTTEGSVVAATLPKDRVPEYSIDGFKYVSAQAGVKQWKLNSKKAFFYQKEGLVHTQEVHAIIYDPQGVETFVDAHEAKYFFNSQDLELFGEVTTTFPDGLKTVSQYMKYQVKDKSISIPTSHLVKGHSIGNSTQEELEFDAHGLFYLDSNRIVKLLEAVQVRAIKKIPGKEPDITTIDSDRAEIDRKKEIAYFSMYESRDTSLRFVRLNQPGMKCQSRRAEFRFGADDKRLRVVRAFEEVKIEETPKAPTDLPTHSRRRPPQKRYSTSGQAEFDSIRNRIILREFPQVYQDQDTITGDVIIVHRNTNQVEVEQSNAYSEGNEDS